MLYNIVLLLHIYTLFFFNCLAEVCALMSPFVIAVGKSLDYGPRNQTTFEGINLCSPYIYIYYIYFEI